MCFKGGSFGDRGNPCCLACEACLCSSCAVSATRMYVMDKYELMSDPCDNQIIRFNNAIQMLACICSILAMFEPSCQDMAEIIRFIADIVFFITAGCMNAQAHVEIKERGKGYQGAPSSQQGGGATAYAHAPKLQNMDQRGNYVHSQQPYASAQPAAVAQAAPIGGQQRTFLVQIPPNVYPGTQLQVAAPNGQQVMFAVPPGAQAGQQVMVPY